MGYRSDSIAISHDMGPLRSSTPSLMSPIQLPKSFAPALFHSFAPAAPPGASKRETGVGGKGEGGEGRAGA